MSEGIQLIIYSIANKNKFWFEFDRNPHIPNDSGYAT